MPQKDAIICGRKMGKHANSVDARVLQHLRAQPPGWVFTPVHLRDLGSRTAVATALKRYKKAGLVRRIARGLYDLPKTDPQFGTLAPSLEGVADALKTRDSIRLQPTGAYAANLLGLSEQVPMRIVYLTDGPPRRLMIGKVQITLRRTTPRNMATAGTASGLVIQALRWMGKRGVDASTIRLLKRRLRDDDRKRLPADARFAPVWIADIMRRIATDEDSAT